MSVIIYEPGTLKVQDVCEGPDESGRCPRANADNNVPCSGSELALSKDESSGSSAGLERRRILVPEQFRLCPTGSRGAIRAVFAAGMRYFHPYASQGE
jgi:hypothetical protein